MPTFSTLFRTGHTFPHLLSTVQGHTDSVWSVALTPDERLITGSADHTAKVWNMATGQCTMTLQVGRGGCVGRKEGGAHVAEPMFMLRPPTPQDVGYKTATLCENYFD